MRRFYRPANRTSIVVGTCLGCMIGVYLGVHGWGAGSWVGLILGVWTLLLWRSLIWWLGCIGLALYLGMVRGDSYAAQLQLLTSQIGRPVQLSGTVVTDPVTNANHRTQVRISSLRLGETAIPGTILLSGYNLRVERSFRVVASGTLRSGFATWDGELSYPKLIVLSDRLPPLEALRQRFFTGMRTALPDPEAAFGLGLLVGVGALIPKPLQLQLTRVGLSHLTAVSGYNLTIIVRLVTRLFRRLGPNVVTILSLWLIAVFVVIAGGSASIIRAGAVSALSLVAGRSGLRVAPLILIATIATATLLYNPAYLRDAGWALSFLAFFGILVLAPALMERFGEPRITLVRMIIETLCAEIMTLPYVLVVFGQMSIIGLIANILVEPMIPLAMALAALAAVAGIWFPDLIPLVGGGAELLLRFILQLVATFAALPWAATGLRLALGGAAAIYGCIAIITMLLSQRSARQARFAILEPDRSTQCLDTQNGPP